ncbi:hypothetical protein ALC56_13154, partial [Trachymyrmex septentrionalis]
YTVVIPVVSVLGIIGNSLILAVHLKAKTYLKAYTYLRIAGHMPRWKSPILCRWEIERNLTIFVTFFAILINKNICEGNHLRLITIKTDDYAGIVFLFLVGELPTHLASRRSAVSLL